MKAALSCSQPLHQPSERLLAAFTALKLRQLSPAQGHEGLADGVTELFLYLVLLGLELMCPPEVCDVALRLLHSDVCNVFGQLHAHLQSFAGDIVWNFVGSQSQSQL